MPDAPLRVGLGVPILGEPNVARLEIDLGAVHRLDEPGALQSHDPQYGRFFVPGSVPARRLHDGEHGRLAGILTVDPFRLGGGAMASSSNLLSSQLVRWLTPL